jgi:DNA-binding IclR family transcriptional regulator
MVKVLKKTFDFLEIIADQSKISLSSLAQETGLQRSAVYHVLNSLVELGYLHKSREGMYSLGDRLFRLTEPHVKKHRLTEIADRYTAKLAEKIHECVVLAVLHQYDKILLSHATYNQTIMVFSDSYRWNTVYDNPTGRILIAYLDEDDLETILSKYGLPSEDVWPEVTGEETLKGFLARIREEGVSFKVRDHGQVQEVAVPVFGNDGKVWAALGSYLPFIRFQGAHRNEVTEGLRATADEIRKTLTATSPGNLGSDHHPEDVALDGIVHKATRT